MDYISQILRISPLFRTRVSHGGDFEVCLLACDAMWPLQESTFLRSIFQSLVTPNVVPRSLILFILMIWAILCSKTSLLARATRRHIPEDWNLHIFCCCFGGVLVVNHNSKYLLCGLVVRVPRCKHRGLGFDSRRYKIFLVVVGLERGPLSPCEDKWGATWKKK
jgi:hypothetical protein